MIKSFSVRVKFFLKEELIKVGLGVVFSIAIFATVALWRVFNTQIFLFNQILVCTFLSLIILYLIRLSTRSFKRFKGNELLIVAVAFILVTYSLVNIDRSRSFFVLKWVAQYSESGVTILELGKIKNLSANEKFAIEKRILEQSQMGFISKKQDKFYITKAGKLLVFVFENFASIENLDGYKKA